MSTTPLLTVPETATALRVSRAYVYQLIASGRLRSVTIGRSRRIRAKDLADFIASL